MTERPKSHREIASAEVPIVYVIDDDVSMRRGLTNLFESVGLRIEAFGSASELLQRKLPDVPSCLVLDIRLPGMSGLDFQDLLEKAAIHVPIVFMTGHGDIPMSVKAMKLRSAHLSDTSCVITDVQMPAMSGVEPSCSRRGTTCPSFLSRPSPTRPYVRAR
jgi:FixJ family two-component response regulator